MTQNLNNNVIKKSLAGIVSLGLLVSLAFISTNTNAQSSNTVDCTEYSGNSQTNLFGYIMVENLPSDVGPFGDEDRANRIFVNSDDDPYVGGEQYAVQYDRQNEIFSGRGWNNQIGWVDFNYGNTNQAKVTAADGSFRWGYWQGIIEGLNNVEYSNEQGNFILSGTAPENLEDTGDGVKIGLGYLDFSNVSFNRPDDIPAECVESIDVLVDGSSNVNLDSCNERVRIQWNSSNVVDCQTVSNGAPWVNPGSRNEVNISGENSGLITESNSPSVFSIECTGELSGDTLRGSAIASCVDPNNGCETDGSCPGGPGDDENRFDFIES